MSDPRYTEIREALDEATPWPWEFGATGVTQAASLATKTGDGFEREGIVPGEHVHDWDAHLIANSPAWLSFLLSRVEELEGVIENAQQAILAAVDGPSMSIDGQKAIQGVLDALTVAALNERTTP